MKGPIERFLQDLNSFSGRYAENAIKKQACNRANELRMLGAMRVHEWSQVESIPVGGNCFETCRVYYVQVIA